MIVVVLSIGYIVVNVYALQRNYSLCLIQRLQRNPSFIFCVSFILPQHCEILNQEEEKKWKNQTRRVGYSSLRAGISCSINKFKVGRAKSVFKPKIVCCSRENFSSNKS